MTDYDALVKALREKSERFSYDGWVDTSIILEQAADAIETMCEMVAIAHNELANVIQSYEESKPRWIPVTERLPEKNGKYICYVKRFGQYVGMQYYYVDVLVFQESCFFEDGIGTKRVTHWMPLPPPPKEET